MHSSNNQKKPSDLPGWDPISGIGRVNGSVSDNLLSNPPCSESPKDNNLSRSNNLFDIKSELERKATWAFNQYSESYFLRDRIEMLNHAREYVQGMLPDSKDNGLRDYLINIHYTGKYFSLIQSSELGKEISVCMDVIKELYSMAKFTSENYSLHGDKSQRELILGEVEKLVENKFPGDENEDFRADLISMYFIGSYNDLISSSKSLDCMI